MKTLWRIQALARLGAPNLLRVGLYRLGLKSGRHPVQRLKADVPEGPFFLPPTAPPLGLITRESWRDTVRYFGWLEAPLDGIPDWHANPFRPGVRADPARPWWRIPDFDPQVGDIKTIWELSRFDWLIAMAQRARSGDASELDRLNLWLDNWSRANPPYLGANWKCGQEASLRVIHLALAAVILDQTQAPTDGLKSLLRVHLRRIAPTLGYAIGQQNNHGTSEAAALYIGGSWLESVGDPDAAHWTAAGRRWLENRARILISPDGTFSQRSVNYHRLMLDTYSFAELWRRRLSLAAFSQTTTDRLAAATRWLAQMVDGRTGGVPNLGANDGAQIILLSDAGYRDFRPSVRRAAALFLDRAAAPDGPGDSSLAWLGLPRPNREMEPPPSVSLDDGGFHMLRRGDAFALLRYPRNRFRPSQSDALHVDLWVRGRNLLRDAGSYSYNSTEEDAAYFKGVAGHNTVELDGRDQMPRLGRFLFGAWLRARDVEAVHERNGGLAAAAGYRDVWGGSHHRDVELHEDRLVCTDRVGGSARRAVLRWRLEPGDWTLDGDTISNGEVQLRVETDAPIVRMACVQGAESLFYLQKTALPVLEVEVEVGPRADVRLTTTVTF